MPSLRLSRKPVRAAIVQTIIASVRARKGQMNQVSPSSSEGQGEQRREHDVHRPEHQQTASLRAAEALRGGGEVREELEVDVERQHRGYEPQAPELRGLSQRRQYPAKALPGRKQAAERAQQQRRGLPRPGEAGQGGIYEQPARPVGQKVYGVYIEVQVYECVAPGYLAQRAVKALTLLHQPRPLP